MKELPKELTSQLLSLVLYRNVSRISGIMPNGDLGYTQGMLSNSSFILNEINIDTLTRLMKEWCYTQGCKVKSGAYIYTNKSAVYCCTDYEEVSEDGDTEFEAVIKATRWIAIEKGLLNKEEL